MSAQAANTPLFRQTVETLLNSWPALQLAVAHQSGGQETSAKAKWLVGVLVGFFADSEDLCPDEVVAFLGDIMDVEFDVYLEDGSLEEISKYLCESFRMIQAGREEEVRARLASLPSPDLSRCREATETQAAPPTQVDPSHVAARLDQMEIGASGSQESSGEASGSAEAENDGWTVVTKSKKK